MTRMKTAAPMTWTRTCIGISFGLWASGMLWLVTWNAWIGVFAVGAALGMCVLENAVLAEWLETTRSEIEELEKQVVSLKTTITLMGREWVERDRAAFRLKRHASCPDLKKKT